MLLSMIDIKKLAKLTGLELTPSQEELFSHQLWSVVELLEKVKWYDIVQPTTTRHDILGLETQPSKTGISDGSSDAILENIAHPITGHAVEVKAFVE